MVATSSKEAIEDPHNRQLIPRSCKYAGQKSRESPGRVYYRAMPDPKPDDVDFHEETTDPLVADFHNFYKVEKWTRDGTKVDSLLYAGNSLGRARSVFEHAIKHRPRINTDNPQQIRMLDQWPPLQRRTQWPSRCLLVKILHRFLPFTC